MIAFLSRDSLAFSFSRREASARTHSVEGLPKKEGRSDAGSPRMRTKVLQALGGLTYSFPHAYTSELPAPSSLLRLCPQQGRGSFPREKRGDPQPRSRSPAASPITSSNPQSSILGGVSPSSGLSCSHLF